MLLMFVLDFPHICIWVRSPSRRYVLEAKQDQHYRHPAKSEGASTVCGGNCDWGQYKLVRVKNIWCMWFLLKFA